MNRQQNSLLRLRPRTINAVLPRIMNHAAKLALEYNQIKINEIMQSKVKNPKKVKELMKLSSTNLPKLINEYHVKYKDKNTLQVENDEVFEENSINNCTYSSVCDETKSLMSTKSISKKYESSNISFESFEENFLEKSSIIYLYEVDIVTGLEKNISPNADVYLVIRYGIPTTLSKKIFLRQYFIPEYLDAKPFLAGNSDKFHLYSSDYFGTIESISVGLNRTTGNESWFLESVCINDIFGMKEYRFSCRRWLGDKCSDKLSEVKLGYIPPYKKDLHTFTNCNIICKNESQHNFSCYFSKDCLNKKLISPKKSTIFQRTSSFKEKISLLKPILHRSLSTDYIKIIKSRGSVLFGKSIHSAIKSHDFERLKELCVFYDPLKCLQDVEGNSPLHLAAMYYEDDSTCREIINFLISLNVNPNIKSKDGYTPFLLAVLNGNLNSVKYFKDVLNVDISTKDLDGNTALHLATTRNYYDIVKYILSKDGDYSIQNCIGETPMDIAQKNNNIKLIKMFNKVIDVSNCSSVDDVYLVENINSDNVLNDKNNTEDEDRKNDININISQIVPFNDDNSVLPTNNLEQSNCEENITTYKLIKSSKSKKRRKNEKYLVNQAIQDDNKRKKSKLNNLIIRKIQVDDLSSASSIPPTPPIPSTPSTPVSLTNLDSEFKNMKVEDADKQSTSVKNIISSQFTISSEEKFRPLSSLIRKPQLKLDSSESEKLMKVILLNSTFTK